MQLSDTRPTFENKKSSEFQSTVASFSMAQDFDGEDWVVSDTTPTHFHRMLESAEADLLLELNLAYARAAARLGVNELPNEDNLFGEAEALIRSGIFTDTRFPRIHIDEFGEASFVICRGGTLVDIGIQGEAEISFHVKREVGDRVFDDCDFSNRTIPDQLREAMEQI